MVTVVKNGKVRICIDPKDLNKTVRCENYPISTVEKVIASMPDAKLFLVIDAKSGFLQIKLNYESSLLATFNTPIGRYHWLRLPFGIKSAPEMIQRIMDTMLEHIECARAIMDDIIVAAKTPREHDRIMKTVITKAINRNLKLNFEKCQIKQSQVKYVGHLVTKQGFKPDPDKVRAGLEVSRFLGFISKKPVKVSA